MLTTHVLFELDLIKRTPMRIFVIFAVLVLLIIGPATLGTSHAVPIVINPSSDGSLYTCDDCNHVPANFVLVAYYIQGAVIFPTAAITESIGQALFSVNPNGLPLWAPSIDVYGFISSSREVSYENANSGQFLGAFVLPGNLGFGQDAYFDVTGFLRNVSSPYVGFNLRAPLSGPDDFSSLSNNLGHPSQLSVTFVPEPSSLTLFAVGIIGLILWRKRTA